MAKKRAAGEGNIRQLPSGSWQAQISLDGRRISKTFKTQREAKEWARKTSGEIIDNGLTYSSSRLTVADYMTRWLLGVKNNLRPKTYKQYEHITQAFILPEFGKTPIRDLRPDQIQSYTDKLSDGKPPTRTVSLVHSVLRAALNKAVKLRIISFNPAALADPPKYHHGEMQTLTSSQCSQLQIAAQDTWLEVLVKVALNTGARESELLALKWDDLDWTKKRIRIVKQLQWRRAGEAETTFDLSAPLKTDNARRSLPLGDDTIQLLHRHYRDQAELRQVAGEKWKEHNLIFTSSVGTPVEFSNLHKMWKRLLVKAGLPDMRFHDLRHTAATIMLTNKVDRVIVSRRLGHARASITEDIYGHDNQEAQEEAAELLDRLTTPTKIEIEKKGEN